MKRLIWMVLLLGALPARATDGDLLLDALQLWATRSVSDLQLGPGAEPQRSVLAALDHDYFHVEASHGSIVEESGNRSRPARVEVVVGNDELNSSRFKASSRLPPVRRHPSLVPDDVDLAIQRDLWITADGAYKSSLQQWLVKTAARSAVGGEPPPPDWVPPAPVEAIDLAPRPQVDRESLRAIAEAVSERYRGIEGLRVGKAEARAMEGHYYLATSEGTALVQPEGYAVVYTWADLIRDDGLRIYDHRQWVARSVQDLPPVEEMADEAERMGQSIVVRSGAETVEYYEGPVVFEGRAAAELFRYLVPAELSGTPPPPQEGKTYESLTRSGPRPGRRLLPRGWSITDDPTRPLPGLAGGYVHDREGVRAEPVSLVEDGYVRDLAMSSIPRKGMLRSNGHARGAVHRDWTARLSIWEVRAHKNHSERAFARQVEGAMKASNLDRILVVRNIWEGKGGSLPSPTDAVWRHADGAEEPAIRLSFSSTSRRTLRDIAVAGGGQITLPYLAPWALGKKPDDDEGLPSVVIAPRLLLVEDMELVFPGPGSRPHAYGPPAL